MTNYPDAVLSKFTTLYRDSPTLVRAPGRVNLIGEHTDYNMGFVLPAAIDKAIYCAVAPRTDRVCCFHALDLDDDFTCELSALHASPKGWPNYLMGVVDQLLRVRDDMRGFNCVFGGTIPLGAGLSSSAALEVSLAVALDAAFGFGIDRMTLVRMAQAAENDFVGIKCGIMDQYISMYGRQGSVVRIDCRSLERTYVPFGFDVAVVLFDTGVKHSLASSEYNTRRQQCAAGVELVRKGDPSITHLRDVTMPMLEECKSRMDATIYRRCRYVVEEQSRVLEACSALERSDLETFGRLMRETHRGLSEDYDVSCPELDFLAASTEHLPGVHGSRMMGGGFGGCTINLVDPDAVEEVSADVTREYHKRFGREARVYVTALGPGARVIDGGIHA